MLVYAAFLRDEYPPFGEGDYPATLELPREPDSRDPAVVALRPLLLIPHLVVMVVLMLAALGTTVCAWLGLALRGRMPDGLWRFNRDIMSYLLRVEAYALLIHDEFPPFALAVDRTWAQVAEPHGPPA